MSGHGCCAGTERIDCQHSADAIAAAFVVLCGHRSQWERKSRLVWLVGGG